jgi:hypothetical protein
MDARTTVYHGTCDLWRAQILCEGIKPHRASGLVYVTRDLKVALDYAKRCTVGMYALESSTTLRGIVVCASVPADLISPAPYQKAYDVVKGSVRAEWIDRIDGIDATGDYDDPVRRWMRLTELRGFLEWSFDPLEGREDLAAVLPSLERGHWPRSVGPQLDRSITCCRSTRTDTAVRPPPRCC